MLDNDVLCVRASRVPENFAEQLRAAGATNKVAGAILDLRFADGGKDVSTGNLFSSHESPLIILVNSQTRGGAAELAAQLRADGRAIVIGGTNASGKITPDIAIAANSADEKEFQENPFANASGKSAYSSGTNDLTPFVDHMSEAELVRKRAKDGEFDEPDMPRAAPAQPVVRDPALARALDLLKALAALHQSRG
jgi:hypothetical protein